jgi:hypothetical protein
VPRAVVQAEHRAEIAADNLAGHAPVSHVPPAAAVEHPAPVPAGEHAAPPVTHDHALPGSGPHDAPLPAGDVAHPLPPDSPLFEGYRSVEPGPEFTAADGSLIYPDDSLASKPYAIPGTIVPDAQLPAGTEIGRFGYPGGSYLAPDGTPFAELSLPPDSATKPYFNYVVNDPTALPPGYHVEQSQVAPWFHQPGGGTQFRIIAPPGKEASVDALIESGYLREVGK